MDIQTVNLFNGSVTVGGMVSFKDPDFVKKEDAPLHCWRIRHSGQGPHKVTRIQSFENDVHVTFKDQNGADVEIDSKWLVVGQVPSTLI